MCPISKINKHKKAMVTSGTDCPDVSMAFLLLVVKEGFNVF